MQDNNLVKYSFSKAARYYDAHADVQREVLRRVFTGAQILFPQACAVLDAGCGTGMFSAMAREAGMRWDITQIDLAAGMCAVAQAHNPRVAAADMSCLPFANAAFDGYVSSLALQWLPSPQAAFSECARVLKPGGRAIFATFGPETLHEMKAAFADVDAAPHVNDFLPADVLSGYFSAGGMTLQRQESWRLERRYAGLFDLMRSIRAVGASNKDIARRKGLASRAYFAKVEEAYRTRFGGAQGISATWEVVMLAGEKT